MPITQITPKSQINTFLSTRMARINAVILRNMAIIGEESVNKAKTNGNYKDRTGNLRSSIGYVLVEDGNILKLGDFKKISKGTTGVANGRSFAREIAKKYTSGITIIVLAGMNYSSHVTKRGYDVLDSARFESKAQAEAFIRSFNNG